MKPKVIYYRWVYSPYSGEVTLSHNQEGHPSNIRFHDEMASDIAGDELVYGYAYRVEGGWKLTDEEHKSVDDSHIRASVERAIDDYEGNDGREPTDSIQEDSQ